MGKSNVFILCVVLLIIADYWLYVTGNPSFIHIILGGLFFIHFIVLAICLSLVWIRVEKGTTTVKALTSGLLIVLFFSFILFLVTDTAREYSKNNLKDKVTNFIENYEDSDIRASQETKDIMKNLLLDDYSLEFESFVPTVRRVDYLIHSDKGQAYRLVLKVNPRNYIDVFVHLAIDKKKQ